MIPAPVQQKLDEYLRLVDAALPGVVTDLYLVGSTAAGAWRPNRSDIDVIALVEERLDDASIDALRTISHRLQKREVRNAMLGLRYPLVVNATYLIRDDLARRPADITPVCGHVTPMFHVGKDVFIEPVTWRELQTRGITVRGTPREELTIHYDDAELRAWNRENLETYWRGWAAAEKASALALMPIPFWAHHCKEWGPLGAPRLHYTIATGEICSKLEAGEYALDTFDSEWHPTIQRALDFAKAKGSPYGWFLKDARASMRFVRHVVDSARDLP